jgi:hypothetical protein
VYYPVSDLEKSFVCWLASSIERLAMMPFITVLKAIVPLYLTEASLM